MTGHELTPDELKAKLDNNEALFLKVWKEGCGPCKLSEPAVERLEKKFGTDLEFTHVNSSKHSEIMEITGSKVLPAFFVFKEKKMLGKFTGFKGLAKLEDMVQKALNG